MLRVAIIGTGAICSSHIAAYRQFPETCEIIALCDIYKEKAAGLAKDSGLDVAIYGHYTDVANRTDIDLVSICTPPYTHAEIAIHFLQAGVHVLVEKPMASSLEECDAMNKAAAQSGKHLSVVAQNRFYSPMMKVKHVLNQNLTGPILHTQVDSFWWRGHCYYDLWWRGTWEKEGGGVTLNHAVHHIDLFQWLNGMPQEVTAVIANTAHDNAEVEDLSIAICSYENGGLAQITSSTVHHGEEQQLIFQGKDARVSVPWNVKASTSLDNGFPEENHDLERELQRVYDEGPSVIYEGHVGQVHNVLMAIEQVESVLIDGYEGRRTLELITAIYQSASLGTSVPLPLTAESPFYTRDAILKNATHFYEKKGFVKHFASNNITTGGNYETKDNQRKQKND